ncbi:hypothetical protein [Lactobacillus delbrueckii]|uniref:hypothetical protein n=1 Tax=Lactobacillus delbrueckii TaxID=1584 RepID=UPI000A6F0544|nr:hypothetical protein [Lactobacillus delbrueckii]
MTNKENLITTNELVGEVYLDKILADDIFYMDCLDEDKRRLTHQSFCSMTWLKAQKESCWFAIKWCTSGMSGRAGFML